MAYLISIANEKGGVAKTTTTSSLGASLAENRKKTLLVDLDAQANLSLALGVDPSRVQNSIVQILLDSLSMKSCVIETSIDSLYILPANSQLGELEHKLPSIPEYESLLKNALQDIRSDYDFILFDCPPFLGAVTVNAVTASDLLLLPTQTEYFSINALRNMMLTIRQVRSRGNPELTYRLLITMFDRRNRIHRDLNEQLRTTFGKGVLDTVIETDTKLRESNIAGVPIIYHAPKSRAALQYRSLAQEILSYVKEPV
jgi:chromosome partitioning protein